MVQVINDPGRAASAGAAMGSGFGQGLGQGISQMAQYKINQMMQRQQRSQLSNVLQQAGYTPQEAAMLSNYPPETQFKMMQLLNPQQPAQPQQSIMNQMEPTQLPQQIPAIQQKPLEQFNMNRSQQTEQLLKPYNPMDAAVSQQIQNIPAKQPQMVQNTPIKQPLVPQQEPNKIIPGEVVKPKTRERLATAGLTPAQRLQEKKALMTEERAKAKEAIAEQHYIDKQVKPYVDLLDKKGGSVAATSDMILDRMNKLIDSGKLTGSTMYNFRKKMEHAGHIIGGGIGTAAGAIGGALAGGVGGSIIPGAGTLTGVLGGAGVGATVGGGLGAAAGEALMPKFVGTKEDQEFTKLSINFIDRLKDIFGGRIAIQEMQLYMDSIPTLAMTDDGKKQVIKDMKMISSGWRHKKEIKDKIVAENKGHSPANIEQLVDEKSKPFMDRLAKQFIA